MKTNKLANKLLGLVMVFMMTWTMVAGTSVASAQTNVLCAAFPCNGILGPNGSIDITSIITLVFRIILYAAVLWTVWNVVLAGLKIAGAKEDADKRKEGIQAVINAVIGLVVALLAFGIVATVTNTLNAGEAGALTGTPCSGIRPDTKEAAFGIESNGKCLLRRTDSTGKVITPDLELTR